jgi:hypothetical protein
MLFSSIKEQKNAFLHVTTPGALILNNVAPRWICWGYDGPSS